MRVMLLLGGGHVLGMVVMSAKNYSLQIAPSQEILHNIEKKHGKAMNEYLRKEFGYGLEQLTNAEAAHVYAYPDADTLRTRITQARYVAGFSTTKDDEVAGESQEVQFARLTWQLRENHHPKAILKTERPTAPCRGRVVFHTENFVIQQVNEGSRYFQAHAKNDLPRTPEVGEKLNISYSQKEPMVRIREMKRSRSR